MLRGVTVLGLLALGMTVSGQTPTAAPTGGCFASGFFTLVSGPCETTESGTCISDGPGLYGNNERCTFRVLKTIPLEVREFATESNHDLLTVRGVSYGGPTNPNGVTVNPGDLITWRTDGSVTNVGWTICIDPYASCYPTPAPTAPTAAPTHSPSATPTAQPTAMPTGGCFASNFFSIVASSTGACSLTERDTCITDGAGFYGNNARCTIRVLKTIPLEVREWGTEANHDVMTVRGVSYSSSTTPNGVTVNPGDVITWRTDGSVTNVGWTICIDPYASCYPTPAPTAPTAAPTHSPSATPTAQPTAMPTGGCFASNFFSIVASSTGACSLTERDTCITDGAGLYRNNARCTIRVLKTIPLEVREWGTEANHDVMTVRGVSYSSSTTPNGVTVNPGDVITWRTDASVTNVGWTICIDPYVSCYPTPAPTAPTAAPTASPTATPTAQPTRVPTGGCFASDFFSIVSGAGTCVTSERATCISDGPGNYGNNERCLIRVLKTIPLEVREFVTEATHDRLDISGRSFSGTSGPQGVTVRAGGLISWTSDHSSTHAGWTICIEPYASCYPTAAPTAPTAAPTLSPTATPTDQPTGVPTGGCFAANFFSVVAGGSNCVTSERATCVSDGPGNYGNNERCLVRVLKTIPLVVREFGTEATHDHLDIAGRAFSGSTGPHGVTVQAGSLISWTSDHSAVGVGWTLCIDPYASCYPTPVPTEQPTAAPTGTPSTGTPVAAPTHVPSEVPTLQPSATPTLRPTTASPVATPTAAPTVTPTLPPTPNPTDSPTRGPTAAPTVGPTSGAPTAPAPSTVAPTARPSAVPTAGPTDAPSTISPTPARTHAPSHAPTAAPTDGPTGGPTAAPTDRPSTAGPTLAAGTPTASPTDAPSDAPSTVAPLSASPSAAPVATQAPAPTTQTPVGTQAPAPTTQTPVGTQAPAPTTQTPVGTQAPAPTTQTPAAGLPPSASPTPTLASVGESGGGGGGGGGLMLVVIAVVATLAVVGLVVVVRKRCNGQGARKKSGKPQSPPPLPPDRGGRAEVVYEMPIENSRGYASPSSLAGVGDGVYMQPLTMNPMYADKRLQNVNSIDYAYVEPPGSPLTTLSTESGRVVLTEDSYVATDDMFDTSA